MLVPVVSAASASWSPAKVPPVIDTVADDIIVESESLIVMLGESVVVTPSSVQAALAATLLRVGGLPRTTLSIWGELVVLPSFRTQVRVLTPPEVELNVT